MFEWRIDKIALACVAHITASPSCQSRVFAMSDAGNAHYRQPCQLKNPHRQGVFVHRKISTVLRSVAVAAAILVGGLALASPASAAQAGSAGFAPATVTSGVVHSAHGEVPALAWKSFTWGSLQSGDCTLFSGATWTLYSDGTATFDGTVTSSDDNDAWLQWAHVQDGNHAEIGKLTNDYPGSDPTEFSENLPDHTQQYRWFAYGNFNANWFNYIQNMNMEYHC
jgi:hypothetical protein